MNKAQFAAKGSPFYDDLLSEIDQYFKSTNRKRTGDWRLFSKSIILLTAFFSLYILIVFVLPIGWISFLLSGLFGLVMALIGFNVMHDACHGSYSSSHALNEVMSYSMNLLGSNQYIWKLKHNRIHHTFTNIDGIDDDIMKVPVLRHCESQPHKNIHRYQHVYMFFLYAISTILWALLTDSDKYFKRSVSGTPMRIPLSEHIIFWVSKAFYIAFYIVVPIMMLGFKPFIIGYLFFNAIFGLTLSLVFQMAHAVEATDFHDANNKTLSIEDEWAIHQIKTTADFAPASGVANWMLGGLNFQVIHHLVPGISHVHYRDIQPIIAKVCERHGVRYNVYRTFGMAMKSHIAYLRWLGNPPLKVA